MLDTAERSKIYPMTDLSPVRWPAGYWTRPAAHADAPLIHRLMTACEGELPAGSGPDAVAADLARPGLDPALDTLLVLSSSGQPAGRAWVHGGRRCEIDVHPAHQGRGLGSSLLDWAEARARRVGSERLAQTIHGDDRTAAACLLRSRGYGPFVTQWLLETALAARPATPEPPAGITVRPFRPGDEHAAYQLTEDAFGAWQKRRKPFEEWARLTVERPAFARELSPVAFDGDRMVGVVLALDVPGSDEGYVDRVAVREDHRNRGIARLLLEESFRGFLQRGRSTCTLWTHSETGALSLYQRMGMRVRQTSTVYGKALVSG
ncbi:GNAT family N-acetyltransferase [Streptomyces sp. NBC_00388]|uniref:GNAT family N-acetyltransferase n=1 Tax=Streptomyces sp. NBC_00388 TaxID=2975735 RepID=UPI002E21A3BE